MHHSCSDSILSHLTSCSVAVPLTCCRFSGSLTRMRASRMTGTRASLPRFRTWTSTRHVHAMRSELLLPCHANCIVMNCMSRPFSPVVNCCVRSFRLRLTLSSHCFSRYTLPLLPAFVACILLTFHSSPLNLLHCFGNSLPDGRMMGQRVFPIRTPSSRLTGAMKTTAIGNHL